MSRKKIWFASVFLVLALATFIAGGCGGSSSSKPGSENHQESDQDNATSSEIPDLIDVVGSDEFITLMGNFLDELQANDIMVFPAIQYVMISNDAVYIGPELTYFARRMLSSSQFRGASLPSEQKERLTEILKPRYDLGDVIALLYPTPKTINDLYEALGEQSTYVSEKGDDEVTAELFAMAKRAGEKSLHFFSYEMPDKNELAQIVSDDTSITEDGEDIENNSPDENYNGNDQSSPVSSDVKASFLFQAERAVNFLDGSLSSTSKLTKLKYKLKL